MKPGDLLRLRGTSWARRGMTRIAWCASPAGEIANGDWVPDGTPALLVDFSRLDRGGERLFVVVNSRTGLVWSEEVEPL